LKIWGKLILGVGGFLIGGYLGAIIGLIIGHQIDRALIQFGGGLPPGLGGVGHAGIQQVFFETTFSVMGHVAKADGRVSEQEIALARQIMAQMGLSEASRLRAIELFSAGKQADFDLESTLIRFHHATQLARNLRMIFLEVQLHAAYADGQVADAERQLLQHLANRLGFSVADLNRLESMIRAERHTGGKVEQVSLDDAYAILNLTTSATDSEVKRAYRKLTNQHHPDKLVAKGLPDDMMKLAEAKTHEIRAAYERIKQARGF